MRKKQVGRNDAQCLRIIETLYKEGVSVPNIVRLLNYHFLDHTYIADVDLLSPVILRANHGHYNSPNITIWKANEQTI